MIMTDTSSQTQGAMDQDFSLFAPPFCDWTPEAIVHHFQTRDTVSFFPVIDPHETRRMLIDDILHNRFTFNQESHIFSHEIPWTHNPSRDHEWIILLHKFYYAVGLGMAYEETHDLRYVTKWMELTESWIDHVPVDFLPSDVAGRRIQNWIFAFYYFVHSHRLPTITPTFLLKFFSSLSKQIEHLCAKLTPSRNHRTLELCAILLAGIVFPEFRQASHWVQLGRSQLIHNIRSDFLDDGVHCELSTDYHHLVLKNLLWIRRLTRLHHIQFPEDIDQRIQQALEFSLYIHKPDGFIPSLSDGDSRSFLDLLEQGHQLYGHESYRFVASRGQKGNRPSQSSKGFETAGYYIMRSGWGHEKDPYEDQRYLVIDCGPLGEGNHGHFDLLSIEMAAFGQTLIVDPGRYTYDESGDTNWRVRFRETAAHNTVVVDGRNQTRYVPGKTKYKVKGPPPDQQTVAFLTQPGFDFFHGVARSHEYPVIHERKIFFIHHGEGPQYWILSDLLIAQEPHTYDLRFHLSPLAQHHAHQCYGEGEKEIMVESPHCILAQPSHPDIRLHLEEGFVSHTYGEKHPAPVVRFTRQAASACFSTLLFPFKHMRPELSIAAEPVYVNGELCSETDASCLRISLIANRQYLEDIFFVNHRGTDESFHFLDCQTRGKFFFLRRTNQGQVLCQYFRHDYGETQSSAEQGEAGR